MTCMGCLLSRNIIPIVPLLPVHPSLSLRVDDNHLVSNVKLDILATYLSSMLSINSFYVLLFFLPFTKAVYLMYSL